MTTPAWDFRQPPVPDPAHQAQDQTGEPVGYNLGDVRYEQPPVPLLLPYGGHVPVGLPTGQATAGFVLSLVGLASTTFLPVIMTPAVIVGLVLSAISLRRCRQGLAGGRGLAIAGLVLGIVGIVLTGLMILFFASVFSTSGP
jgi:Domain of unknown function (DUF4190)